MKISPKVILCITLALMLLHACQKPKVIKMEESACKSSVKDTSFTMALPIGWGSDIRFYDTDTVLSSWNSIYFTANDSTADEYLWQFAGDPRIFTGRQVKLAFTREEQVNITLTQKRSRSNPCVGHRPAEQVFTRRLTVVPLGKEPILGQYAGYNSSNPAVKFTIEILDNGMRNLPVMATGPYDYRNEIDYAPNAFYIKGMGTYDPAFGAYATEGFGFLKNGNTAIQINYSYKTPASSDARIKDTFYGIKKF